MRWDEIAELNCSIARTLAVIGDRWTLLVLRDAFMGVRRFEHFQADLKVTRHVLADRLRKLEREGILRRVGVSRAAGAARVPADGEGMELYPIMISMLKWGDRWTAEGKQPFELMHRKCGGAASPKLVCGSCGEELTARDVQPRARSEAGAGAIGGGVESPGETG
jgi:DNA-binding HxlR family transcriptional regulator